MAAAPPAPLLLSVFTQVDTDGSHSVFGTTDDDGVDDVFVADDAS